MKKEIMGYVAVASTGPYIMQIICTSLQTDNHTSTSSLNFFAGRMLFLTPNQQRQSTEGNYSTQGLEVSY